MSIETIDTRFANRLRQKDFLGEDYNEVSVRNNVITLKRKYAHAPEDMVKYALELVTRRYGKKYLIDTIDTGEVFPGKDAHRFVKFRLICNRDEMVTVHNLQSGKPVQISAYDKGGCCDPSTETYWSM